jgi:hypothetical protein
VEKELRDCPADYNGARYAMCLCNRVESGNFAMVYLSSDESHTASNGLKDYRIS